MQLMTSAQGSILGRQLGIYAGTGSFVIALPQASLGNYTVAMYGVLESHGAAAGGTTLFSGLVRITPNDSAVDPVAYPAVQVFTNESLPAYLSGLVDSQAYYNYAKLAVEQALANKAG